MHTDGEDMNKEEISTILKNEISIILNVDTETVNVDTPLHDLGFDSLSFVDLLVSIEKQFKITLMETDLRKDDFKNIATLSERIESMS